MVRIYYKSEEAAKTAQDVFESEIIGDDHGMAEGLEEGSFIPGVIRQATRDLTRGSIKNMRASVEGTIGGVTRRASLSSLEKAARGGGERSRKNKHNSPVTMILDYIESSGVWGLELPLSLVWEMCVVRPDITPPEGWETGRPSEPAFMGMNLHTLCVPSKPTVVLYQYAEEPSDPTLPPHGTHPAL